MGEIVGREGDPGARHAGAPAAAPHPAQARQPRPDRRGLQVGRRGRRSSRTEYPADAVYVERREYGPFIGRAVRLTDGDREMATGSRRRAGGPAGRWSRKAARGPRRRSGARARRDRRRQLPHRAGPPAGAQAGPRAPGRTPAWTRRRPRRRLEAELAALQGAVRRCSKSASAQTVEAASRVRLTLRRRRRRREGPAGARRLPGRTRPTSCRRWGRARVYAEPAVGVPQRRPARVEHRGRHLPGDLRHRDDGAAS